jgi:hypothetical protein
MLYREIIAVCSEIHTKHINSLCGQNVEFETWRYLLGCGVLKRAETVSRDAAPQCAPMQLLTALHYVTICCGE